MNREQFVDRFNLLEIESKDKWFDLLNQGYIGNQSGNPDRIYFIGEKMGMRAVYARTIRNVDREETPRFELDSIEELKLKLRSSRTYWILKLNDLKLPLVKEAIYAKQDNVITRPVTLQEHTSNRLEFSEEQL